MLILASLIPTIQFLITHSCKKEEGLGALITSVVSRQRGEGSLIKSMQFVHHICLYKAPLYALFFSWTLWEIFELKWRLSCQSQDTWVLILSSSTSSGWLTSLSSPWMKTHMKVCKVLCPCKFPLPWTASVHECLLRVVQHMYHS